MAASLSGKTPQKMGKSPGMNMNGLIILFPVFVAF